MSASTSPGGTGRYGAFGGRYVPETLVPALDRLQEGVDRYLHDAAFQAEFQHELNTWVGRPTALSHARALSRRWGAEVWLKREDLAHTGAHKINNAVGQTLLAKRLGAKRIIAETGAGQHGVASAAAAARLGMPCIVYMGAVDVERQAPNVGRMQLMGATVVPVTSGDRTLRAAIDEALRDWVADPDGTYYSLGSAVGPHPYPYLVRELQAVIGREARAQMLELAGGLPDLAVACVGGGSNAIGLFHPFLADRDVALLGVEAGGRGAGLGDNAASLTFGTPGVLQGSYTLILQDEFGQVRETHSVSAGLDYSGVGPEHAFLQHSGRVQYESATDAEALDALLECARHEGVLPAIETAHAFVGARRHAQAHPGCRILIGCSGRGDKDMSILQRTVLSDMTPAGRISAAIVAAAAAGRPALVAYLTAGFPSRDGFKTTLAEVMSACDVVEIGVPFSDPMADGATIQRASFAALAAGVTLPWILAELRACAPHRVPVLLMSYLNPLLQYGLGRLTQDAAAAGVGGLIVPDLPFEEADELKKALGAADLALIQMVSPLTPAARLERLCADAQGFVYAVTMTGTTGKSVAVPEDVLTYMDRVRRSSRVPVCAGFGIRTAAQIARFAGHVDGVVVGSALVETLERGEDVRAYLQGLRGTGSL